MPQDECTDCERHFPGGGGLTEGRCPSCQDAFLDRQREAATAEPAERRREGEEE